MQPYWNLLKGSLAEEEERLIKEMDEKFSTQIFDYIYKITSELVCAASGAMQFQTRGL